jgi:ABC-type molybdate transport system substrate-binding protein
MTTEYSAAVVAEASNPTGGQAFVSLLSDRDVQSELRRQGFDLP